MEFGEKIKMLRKQQGLTLQAVADIVGVGKSTVRKWESGQIANMRRDKIALLAKALCVSPGYLMDWEDGPKAAPLKPEKAKAQTTDEDNLLTAYRKLNPDGQHMALGMVESLTLNPAYTQDTSNAVG